MGDTSQSSLMGNNENDGKSLVMERSDIGLKLPQVRGRNKNSERGKLGVVLSN